MLAVTTTAAAATTTMDNSNLQASGSSSTALNVKLSSNYCSACDIKLSGFEERRVHAKSERQ